MTGRVLGPVPVAAARAGDVVLEVGRGNQGLLGETITIKDFQSLHGLTSIAFCWTGRAATCLARGATTLRSSHCFPDGPEQSFLFAGILGCHLRFPFQGQIELKK